MLAEIVLALHVGVILFNLFWLVAIPLGAWRGWRFVHFRIWRGLHLLCQAVVALQALLGRACFLTLWQAALEGSPEAPRPLIQRWVESVIYWRLPGWFFALLYCLVLLFAAALWRWVPPLPPARPLGKD